MTPRSILVSLAVLALAIPASADDWGTDDGEWVVAFDLRLAIGGALKNAHRGGLALDGDIMLRIGLEDNPGDEWVMTLLIEGGATGFLDEGTEDIYGSGGIGIGWFHSGFILGVVPKFVGGQLQGGRGFESDVFGLEISFIAEWIHMFGFQAGAQIVTDGQGKWATDMRVTVSMNLLPILIFGWAG